MLRAALAAALICGLASGCTAEPAPTAAAQDEYFTALIARAEQAGASEEQLAALRSAANEGGVNYAQVDALMGDYFDCIQDAGMRPERLPDRQIAPGVKAPDYAIDFARLGPAQGDLLNQACLRETMDFAMEALYQQPSSMDAQVADGMAHLDEIAECTAEHGYPLAASATFDEVREAVWAVIDEAGVDCAPSTR